MNNLSVDERLSALEKNIDSLTSLIDKQTQREPKSINHSGGQGNTSYNYKDKSRNFMIMKGFMPCWKRTLENVTWCFRI